MLDIFDDFFCDEDLSEYEREHKDDEYCKYIKEDTTEDGIAFENTLDKDLNN